MSVVRYQSASSTPVKHGHGHGHSRVTWGLTGSYPTPRTTVVSSPQGLEFQRKQRFATCSPPSTQAHDRLQPEQKHNSVPKSFEIISPSGKKQHMIFVERVCHITTMVEYGLVPADSKQRRCMKTPSEGTFFFAERRPSEQKGKQQQQQQDQEKDRKKNKKANKEDEENPKIPTLLEQLVKLRVLKIIPTVRCKSIQHNGSCLVRILLSDNEIAHSCSSPRHTYFLYEAPGYTRFKVCTGCRSIPHRRGVYYCSEACLAADWKRHRLECSKTRSQLLHIISMLPTIIHPKPPAPAHLRVQTHRPLWYRAMLWMGYAQQTNKDNIIDLKEWKLFVKERKVAGCKDLLPGF